VKSLKLAAILIGGIAVVVALLVLVAGREKTLEIIFGPLDLSPVDFATLRLSEKPNQFLVCAPGYCAATAHMTSPVFAGSADDLKQRWMAMVKNQPRVEMGAADEAAMQYDFIQRSELVRYPDSITVRFIPLDGGRATLAVYSRSHYGRGDFGVNEARIRAWLAALAGS
jgi:uncharacterized protein (DUF1499 family)